MADFIRGCIDNIRSMLSMEDVIFYSAKVSTVDGKSSTVNIGLKASSICNESIETQLSVIAWRLECLLAGMCVEGHSGCRPTETVTGTAAGPGPALGPRVRSQCPPGGTVYASVRPCSDPQVTNLTSGLLGEELQSTAPAQTVRRNSHQPHISGNLIFCRVYVCLFIGTVFLAGMAIEQSCIIKLFFITSERAQRAERVLSYLREKTEYSRPGPTRPDPARPHHAL